MAETENANTEAEATEAQPMSIFLTAGTNAVASQLTQQLVVAGHKVTAMTTTKDGANLIRANGGLPVFSEATRVGELSSMMKMVTADMVVNLAPQAALQLPFNVDFDPTLAPATEALVAAAKAVGVKYIVHTSYAFLYDGHGGLADENAALVSTDGVIVSAGKAMEAAIQGSEIPYCILRGGYTYGADSAALSALVDTVKVGRPVYGSTATGTANWVSAHDYVSALLLVIERQPADELFNIVDDAPASPAEFVGTLTRELGLNTAEDGLIGRISRLFGNPKAAELLALSAQASNAKAKEQLGWSLKFATHEAGLQDILLTWRAQMSVKAE